jgi:hypothetical protein
VSGGKEDPARVEALERVLRVAGTIPGAPDVVEIDGGRLFFPDEGATDFSTALRRHWDSHP